MRLVAIAVSALILVWGTGCAVSKATVRMPLAVKPSVPSAVAQYNTEGMREYQSGHYQEAKALFEQAVAGAPDSAEAHYNLGLALFALGAGEQAREHFIEAANLAPGDKVIWDSPALRPFGSPEPNMTKTIKEPSYSNQRPTFGGGPRRY